MILLTTSLLLASSIIVQPCQSLLDDSNPYCPVQRKVVFIRQVKSIFDEEQNAFDQLVNIMLLKTCIVSVSTLALDEEANKIHHFQDWEQLQSAPADFAHIHDEKNRKSLFDINEFVNDHMIMLESQKQHNSSNTVFVIAIRRRVTIYKDLLATFKRIFGKDVIVIVLCIVTNLKDLFSLVPFHRIILLWSDMSIGKNSHGFITDLALNPDHDRYKMAEYFVADAKLTESCFKNKNNTNTSTTTTTTTVLYVWLIHSPLYFPKPELTPLVQLLMFLRRKLRDVGARLEIVTHIKYNNLRVAFESLGFVCHTERMRSYIYGFGGFDYNELFDELIPKYNEFGNKNKNTDQKTVPTNKTKTKILHLNINSYGTPRSILTRFKHQMVSIRYDDDNLDFKVTGNQLYVNPLVLATDEPLETLLNIFDEKACALS